MHDGLIPAVLMLLVLGLGLVLVAQRLGVSALIAYLITGGIVSGTGLIDDQGQMTVLGEIGATLLLFSLGLEMDLPGMRRRLRQVLTGASIQIGATIAVGYLVMSLLGTEWRAALTIGCCLSLSSTLLVLRALEEQNLRYKETGQNVLGLLLTQDVCLAPMAVLLTMIMPGVGEDAHAPPVWLPLAGGLALVVLTVLMRQVVVGRLFDRIVAARVPELEVAFSVTVAIGAAVLTDSVGLGTAVGAFCAGLALGGDEHRHSIETATRPLQGLMAIIFFITIGMQFDLDYVIGNPVLVLVALLVSVLIKSALAGLAMRLAGLELRQAIGAGLMVGQVGEFSFVLAAKAAAPGGPLDADTFNLVVAVACLSMAGTPLLMGLAKRFLPSAKIDKGLRRGESIVVAGLGPVGNTVVEALHHQGVQLLLVDRNPRLLDPWRETRGIICIEGRIEVMDDWLPRLGERPRIVVLTFPIADTSALVAERLHAIDPRLTIIARAPFLAQRQILHQAGIARVICDEEATAAALQPILVEALSGIDRRMDTGVFDAETGERQPIDVTVDPSDSSDRSDSPESPKSP